MEITREISTTINVVSRINNYSNSLHRAIEELKSITHQCWIDDDGRNEIRTIIDKLETLKVDGYYGIEQILKTVDLDKKEGN